MNALATSTSHLGHARAGAPTRIGVFSPRWEHRTEGKPSSSGRSTWRSCTASAEIAADHINYLQPEPLLSEPVAVQNRAERGQVLPAYSYALNNPIAFTDPDGLGPSPKLPCTLGDSTYSCCIKQNLDNPEKCGGEPSDPWAKCAALALAAYDACIASGKSVTICVEAMDRVYKNCVKKIGPQGCNQSGPESPRSR